MNQSLLTHYQENKNLASSVPPNVQTIIAQRSFGSMNLSELEGLSVDGAQLTKLVLSLGRVFQVMASDVSGHTPEVNEFRLSTGILDVQEDATVSEAERLLNAAVMHLALLRARKAISQGTSETPRTTTTRSIPSSALSSNSALGGREK